MKQFTFTLLLLIIQWANAQEEREIAPDQIKAITYASKSSPSFYIQKGKNSFLRVEFELEDNEEASCDDFDIYTSKFVCYSDEKSQTLSEILKGEQGIIYTKEIRRTHPSDFIGKSFALKQGFYDKKRGALLKIVNPFLALTYEILSKKDLIDDYPEKDYYSFIPLNLGSDKYIYILLDKNDDQIIIVPLKYKTILLCDTPKGYSKLSSFYKKEPDYNTLFDDYTPKNFMTLRHIKEGYELVDIFNRKILPSIYDSIHYTRTMLITKKGEEYSLYQYNLQPKLLKDVKVIHLLSDRDNEFEVLTDKGAYYYSNEGQPLRKLSSFYYGLCGTISRSYYTLKKDSLNTAQPHYMLYQLRGATRSYADKRFYLTDRSPDETLTFVEGNIGVEWNVNKEVVGHTYPHPQFVRVQHNGKYGLFEYNFEFDFQSPHQEEISEDSDKSFQRKKRNYPDSFVIGKELLPIVYDHIQQQDNGLIYFYLNGKIGIYPQQKTATYSAIEPETRSFFRIIKDGKKGYLDIKTFKEYFF